MEPNMRYRRDPKMRYIILGKTDKKKDLVLCVSFTDVFERKKKKTVEKEDMIKEVKAIRNEQMGYLQAAKRFGVPKEELVNLNLGKKQTSPDKLTQELVDYCTYINGKQVL
ncbi:CENP-B N-terminal DNA-binding domain [Popillia japonica]|uniref:CENP-B N-terminal DNA-binding domain n=1 Tax=Popillia japonica TaxID=7064 RepID=A0AAW1L768_POPJA